MNISDVNTTALRSEHLKHANVGQAGAAQSSPIRPDAEAKTEAARDRVEISDKARASLADGRRSEELTFARKALESVPELSEERLTLLKDRIASGFYSKPEVVEKIADRVASDLGGTTRGA